MVLFNYATKELTAKVVYYGPGLCGKTTNLQHIYDTLPGAAKGKMLSLATKTDRTLFFDFLPIDLGNIRGMKTKIQLYTVPGQVFYDTTRKLVLKGADGVVFVADSQEAVLDANQDSFENLIVNLNEQGLDIEKMPHVIQYNKRDMKNALPVEVLEKELNRFKTLSFEAVATVGDGVFETLKGISKLVLRSLGQRYGLETNGKKAPQSKSVSTPPHRPSPQAPVIPPKSKPVAAPKPAAEPKPIAPPLAAEPKPAAVPKPVVPPVAAEPKPVVPPVAAEPVAPTPKPVPIINPQSEMAEIEFIEEDTIEKADAVSQDDSGAGLDFEDPSVDLDDSALLVDSFEADPPIDDEPVVEVFNDESIVEELGDDLEAVEDFEDMQPLPDVSSSEVIELDDVEPIEIEELDDMAEIASMASGSSSTEPQEVQNLAEPEPIEVPISIHLPTALGGKPLRLQINITFVD